MQSRFYLLRNILFLIIPAILNAGCTKKAVISHYPSTQNILLTISNAVSKTDTLSAAARINLTTPQGYFPLQAALVIKKPSYLRLELLPPLGPPDLFLAATPQEMKVLLPGKGEFYQGTPDNRNLARFLPWTVNIEDIVAIFTCTYPPLTGDIAYQSYPEKNNLRVEMKVEGKVVQTLWIEPAGRLSRLERLDEKGKLLYTASFSDYREGSPIAGEIDVRMADGIASIDLKYSDLKIEKTDDLSIFDLPVPAGFKKVIMD
jgi:hypothetical protein